MIHDFWLGVNKTVLRLLNLLCYKNKFLNWPDFSECWYWCIKFWLKWYLTFWLLNTDPLCLCLFYTYYLLIKIKSVDMVTKYLPGYFLGVCLYEVDVFLKSGVNSLYKMSKTTSLPTTGIFCRGFVIQDFFDALINLSR